MLSSNSDSIKIPWKDEILVALDLSTSYNYSFKDIENQVKIKFKKKSNKLILDSSFCKLINIMSWSKRDVRLSFVMNHLINNFTIKNEKPTSKFYSNSTNFEILNQSDINDICNDILV